METLNLPKPLSGNFFLDALVEANKKLHALEEQKILNDRPKNSISIL